jgi:hypothetical protein
MKGYTNIEYAKLLEDTLNPGRHDWYGGCYDESKEFVQRKLKLTYESHNKKVDPLYKKQAKLLVSLIKGFDSKIKNNTESKKYKLKSNILNKLISKSITVNTYNGERYNELYMKNFPQKVLKEFEYVDKQLNPSKYQNKENQLI